MKPMRMVSQIVKSPKRIKLVGCCLPKQQMIIKQRTIEPIAEMIKIAGFD